MTQVPEAYEQAKNYILFHNYCITKKLVTLNSHMNSANKAVFMSCSTQPQYTTHHNGTYNAHWY